MEAKVAKLVKINFWDAQYPITPTSPLKATAKRKLFTSLLIGLFMVAVGTAFYIHILQTSKSGSIEETLVNQPAKKSFSQKLALSKLRTASFIKDLVAIPECREIYVDGDNAITILFASDTNIDIGIIRDTLNKLCRTPRLADTLRLKDTLFAVFTCLLPPSREERPELISVEPYGRAVIMATIDSLATTLGISEISKKIIGTYEIQETLLSDEKTTEMEQINAFRFTVSGQGQKIAWAELIRRSLEFNEAIMSTGATFYNIDTLGICYGKISWDIFQIIHTVKTRDSLALKK